MLGLTLTAIAVALRLAPQILRQWESGEREAAGDLLGAGGPTARERSRVSGGGRSWWAHRENTRIDIQLTIPPEKAEDYLHFLESVCVLASF